MSSPAPSSGFRKSALLVGLLALVTGGHWFVQEQLAGGKPMLVSRFDPGETIDGLVSLEVADFRTGATTTLLGEATCEVVVFYAATCPFCHEAALKEARREAGLALPTTWVTDTDDEGAREFTDFVHEDTRVVFHEGMKKKLGIQAVPAGFLIRNGVEILDAWPYRGNEPPERYEGLCEKPAEI